MVLRNDYSSYVKKSGYGMRTEECCRYYGIPVDAKKQHNATYDTTLCHNVLKKQRPEWFGI
jgi:DNA polymerase III epsilon subunit-like protein